MKTAVFSFSRPSDNSITASSRIAQFISATLNIPLFWDVDIAEQKLDVLILVNGAFAFCKVLPELAKAVESAGVIIWVQNDYTIVRPINDGNAESPFRKAFLTRAAAGKPHLTFWTTVKNMVGDDGEYINWNQLTYEPLGSDEAALARKCAEKDLFYYGAWREGRRPVFDRYFKDAPVPVVISSTAKQFKQYEVFDDAHHPVAVCDKMMRGSFYAELAHHGLGLYVEDKKSSVEFHSPANRFYEMLSAGLPMVFQPEAVNMLYEAGYDVAPYVVRSAADLPRLMRKREVIGAAQREQWSMDYVGALRKDVKTAYRKLTRRLT